MNAEGANGMEESARTDAKTYRVTRTAFIAPGRIKV